MGHNMSKLITVYGYWNGDNEPLIATCKIGLDIGEDDDDIFFYFSENEQIIGCHADFTIEEFEQ